MYESTVTKTLPVIVTLTLGDVAITVENIAAVDVAPTLNATIEAMTKAALSLRNNEESE
jgi:hypothetical protein